MATAQHPIEVVVEIEPAAEPIRGAVRTDRGRRDFDGWIELTAVLEAARAGETLPLVLTKPTREETELGR